MHPLHIKHCHEPHLLSVVEVHLWLDDAGKPHAATTHVLILHQQLSVLTLLLAAGLEEGSHAGQGHIVAVEVGVQGVVHV
jgi:hypothetical protein